MQQGNLNELPDVEVLGEWDNGMMDPVFPHMEEEEHNIDLRDLKNKVMEVEHKMEDAVKDTFHRMEHAMEDMIHQGTEVQALNDELAGVDLGVALAAMSAEEKKQRRRME